MRRPFWTVAAPMALHGPRDVPGPGSSAGPSANLDQAGIALVTTLLVVLVVGALVMGAVILGSNQMLVERYQARQAALMGLADAGLEIARARLNGDPALPPDSGFLALEEGVRIQDGEGDTIPAVKRWVYLGPLGAHPGGASNPRSRPVNIVSVVRGDGGGMAVRRQLAIPESLARFGFLSAASEATVHLHGGEHFWGPFHANGPITIAPSGARFHGPVSTAHEVQGSRYGEFPGGLRERSSQVSLPSREDLLALRPAGAAGHSSFLGTTEGDEGEATLRIEFVPVDLNQDGDVTDQDEGFFRAYSSPDPAWVAATPTLRDLCPMGSDGESDCETVLEPTVLRNCGDLHEGRFVAAMDHDRDTHGHDGAEALREGSARCYLGGAEEIWGGFMARDGRGEWLPWNGEVDPRLLMVRPQDAPFLHPLSTHLNPGSLGVIFVDGKVVVSGQLRGRVTLVATGDIILGDDLTYVTDPSDGGCADLAGWVTAGRFVISNNMLNGVWRLPGDDALRLFDETEGEFIHGVVMALGGATAQDHDSGPLQAGACEGPLPGRGCLYLTGGLIQGTPGILGRPDGRGYQRRLSYDQCAAQNPPPQFPSTGMFNRGPSYPVDPSGFDLTEYFQRISSPGSLPGRF